ncbi:MAG: hypothetical protein M3Z23_03460 [Acidobacteriota bacterium]|nr:hypothetical protein [Acidobacteriota bacterium]
MRTALSPPEVSLQTVCPLEISLGRVSLDLVSLDTVADPNYDQHPAYGLAFPPPALSLRVKALARLAPWLGFAIAKQLFLGDRLPAMPRDGDGLEGGLMRRLLALPKYVPCILRTFGRHCWGVLFPIRRAALETASAAGILGALYRDGIAVTRFPEDDRAALQRRVAAPMKELLALREGSSRSFKGNQTCFTRREHGDLIAFVTAMYARRGLLEAAAGYLGRPVEITRMVLQVNDPRDAYLYSSFPDVGLPNSRTNYLHIDRAYGCLKSVIYLSEVGERNGPFCFVRGSTRMSYGALGGILRRAVDRAGLAECDRETRQLFMALPGAFRKKSAFGSDLLDGSANSERLLDAEYRVTSDQGNVALFDNLGIHRGALVEEGQRRAIFVTFA